MTTEDEEIEDDEDEEFSSSSSCFDRQSERFSVVSETKLVVIFQRSSRANRTYNQLKVRRVQQNHQMVLMFLLSSSDNNSLVS